MAKNKKNKIKKFIKNPFWSTLIAATILASGYGIVKYFSESPKDESKIERDVNINEVEMDNNSGKVIQIGEMEGDIILENQKEKKQDSKENEQKIIEKNTKIDNLIKEIQNKIDSADIIEKKDWNEFKDEATTIISNSQIREKILEIEKTFPDKEDNFNKLRQLIIFLKNQKL